MTEKNTEQPLRRDAYTLKETAQKLGISYMSAFRLVQRGLLKPCVALRIKLISQREIDRFQNSTIDNLPKGKPDGASKR